MKVIYTYNKDKDVWCLLNKGKRSNNSSQATEVYKQLVEVYGNRPTKNETSSFIDDYFLKNRINPREIAEKYQKDWDLISDEFQKRAEEIFNISLPHDIISYLTINQRSPYNIKNNFYYVSLHASSARMVAMHELWHFYTWYGLGTDQEEELGKQKYNDLKESLTVLLNLECKDLFPGDVMDKGYPQHKELRDKILEFWSKDRNIFNLWEFLKN